MELIETIETIENLILYNSRQRFRLSLKLINGS